ncbi:hypothetical protein HELRODRAFT_194277 [Helobdella robusta]|uniref:Translation initiation factor eIF2B subunit delta n=1 Tax=Helobdella robusta TaxID=6412 RepID=T1FVW1_HELRO|nr:hypothetical protein HELRODRAFT_194277 [Helobdella robusta]ESN92327.1 hypothetical protein HELRODRAFT_194277 [Helobdella robusta]
MPSKRNRNKANKNRQNSASTDVTTSPNKDAIKTSAHIFPSVYCVSQEQLEASTMNHDDQSLTVTSVTKMLKSGDEKIVNNDVADSKNDSQISTTAATNNINGLPTTTAITNVISEISENTSTLTNAFVGKENENGDVHMQEKISDSSNQTAMQLTNSKQQQQQQQSENKSKVPKQQQQKQQHTPTTKDQKVTEKIKDKIDNNSKMINDLNNVADKMEEFNIKKKSQPTENDLINQQQQQQHELQEVTDDSLTKSKSQLRAERRAVQEAQRAAKLAAKQGGAVAAKQGGTPSAKQVENSQVKNTTASAPAKPVQAKVMDQPASSNKVQTSTTLVPQMKTTKQPKKSATSKKSSNKKECKQQVMKMFHHLLPTTTTTSTTTCTTTTTATTTNMVDGDSKPCSISSINFSTSQDGFHPSILKLGQQYSEEEIIGSNARELSLVKALKHMLHDYSTPINKEFSRDFMEKLAKSIEYLKSCKPLTMGMVNITKYFKHHINKLEGLFPGASDDVLRTYLNDRLTDFVNANIILATKRIINEFKLTVMDGDVFLVYGCSPLVIKALTEAFNMGKSFKVFVADTDESESYGRLMAEGLITRGMDCTFLNTSVVSTYIYKITKVLVGPEAVFSNGSIMCPTGISAVIISALLSDVSVVALCETFKFCDRAQIDSIVQNEMGLSVESTGTNKEFEAVGLKYDLSPARLVPTLITELGSLPSRTVSGVYRLKWSATLM